MFIEGYPVRVSLTKLSHFAKVKNWGSLVVTEVYSPSHAGVFSCLFLQFLQLFLEVYYIVVVVSCETLGYPAQVTLVIC